MKWGATEWLANVAAEMLAEDPEARILVCTTNRIRGQIIVTRVCAEIPFYKRSELQATTPEGGWVRVIMREDQARGLRVDEVLVEYGVDPRLADVAGLCEWKPPVDEPPVYEMTSELYPAADTSDMAQYLCDSGLLFLVNTLLHHYGYALAVSGEDVDGKFVVDGLAINRTSDPDGWWFDEDAITVGRKKLKAAGHR